MKIMKLFHKYFIPHEGNDYKPHLLRNEIAFGLLGLILVLEAVFLAQALLFGRGGGFLALILPNTLVDQTNSVRLSSNLPALAPDPLLTAAAQQKANDMAARGYFAHTSPQGLTPWYWFKQVGYAYTYAGENLAVNFSDSGDVTRAWMDSPGHRANILNGNYTRIGIATAQGNYQGAPTVFVVQLFAKPAAAAPVVAVAPPPAPAPAPTPTPTPAPQPAPEPIPAPAPAPAPAPVVAAAPEPEPEPEPPSVVPIEEVDENQGNFVAIEGTASGTVPGATEPDAGSEDEPGLTVPDDVAAGAAGAAGTTPVAVSRQSNFVQRMFAAPRTTSNFIYLSIGLLVLFALILNAAFLRTHHFRHPQLVLNGLALILALGALAIFNQQILLANTQIF